MTELIFTSSVLILVITALRFCLRGRISARLQYALWGLVALRLLLPFSLFESPISVMKLLPETPAMVQSEIDPAADPGATPIQPEEQPLPPAATVGMGSIHFGTLATMVWLSGAAFCGLVFLTANLRMSRTLRKSRVRVEVPGCKTTVYIVDGLPSPCLYGLWKPVIYLTPESMEDSERRTHILAHEQTHYQHKDHLWALLRAVCVCLHWYSPLVWLAAALSRQDGELACDESTLQKLGDESRIAYGKTLIELMTTPTKPSDLFCCATTMSGGKGEITERLRRIVKKPKMLAIAVIVVALIAIAVVSATFGGAVNTDIPANALADQLWSARTQYVGDASAVGKLVGLLPVPQGLQYDHFELHTSEPSYDIEIVYTATPNIFAQYDRSEIEVSDPFRRNALALLALVDNANGIRATIQSGDRTINLISLRTWAEDTVGSDVRSFAQGPEQVAKLLEFPLTTAPAPGSNGPSKPIAPIIQEDVAAVTITHRVGGANKVYVATGVSLDNVRAWAAGLQYEHKTFSKGTFPGDVEGGEVYSFTMTEGDYPEFSYTINGKNDCYLLMQGEWYSVSNPSAPPYDRNEESPESSYSFTRFGKGGEVISIAALTDEKLAKSIIMNYFAKSSARKGVDVKTLETYYLIVQTFPASGETHDYYAYLLDDGPAVLQAGSNGYYNSLSQELYDELDGIYARAMERTTDVLHDLTANGAVALTAADLHAYRWYTNSESIRVELTAVTSAVVIDLYAADNKNDALMTFTLNAEKLQKPLPT